MIAAKHRIALAVALALVAAGCGSDTDPDQGAPIGTVAQNQPPATSSETPTDVTETPDEPESPEETAVSAAPATAPPPETAPSETAPPETVAAEVPANLAEVRVALREVARVDQPLTMIPRPGDPLLYIGERPGRVVTLDPTTGAIGEPLLDWSSEISTDGERGLLGIAFSPAGDLLYLSWTDLDGATRISEVAMTTAGTVDQASRREIFQLEQPFSNHNGGQIVIGPDRLLYLALGDGGAGGDPLKAGQDLGTPLGSIIRIDPTVTDAATHGTYGIPPDNPWGTELYVIGLRNPWRFSFDRVTDDLWIGDVGQGEWEEIDFLPAGSIAGANLGWSLQEGFHDFDGPPPPDNVAPFAEYGHDVGVSITGGYRYRGSAIPNLVGAYVFGDFSTAQVWAIAVGAPDASIESLDVGVGENSLASFAEDADGELYVLSLEGSISRIEPA